MWIVGQKAFILFGKLIAQLLQTPVHAFVLFQINRWWRLFGPLTGFAFAELPAFASTIDLGDRLQSGVEKRNSR